MGTEIFGDNEIMTKYVTAIPVPLVKYVNSLLTPTSNVLDIGCGTKAIANSLHCAKVTTLDAWKEFEPDIWCDLTTIPSIPCENNSYDVVLMLDVIEHMSKDKGFRILKEVQRITKNLIIVLTPLWWDANTEPMEDPNSPYYKNTFDQHLSLWEPEDFIGFERVTSIEIFKNYFLGVWRKNEAN